MATPAAPADIQLLQRFAEATDMGSFSTAELRRIAELKGVIKPKPFKQQLLEEADKLGLPDTAGAAVGGGVLGSLTGGPIGTVIGAILGAGGARYGVERFKGNPEAASRAIESGMLSGTLPAAGRIMRNVAGNTMRTALPITDEVAEDFGERLGKHKGVDAIVQDILNKTPGMSLKRAYDIASKKLTAAQAEDATARAFAMGSGKGWIDPTKVASNSQDFINRNVRGAIHSPGQLSGAESVPEEFLDILGRRSVNRPMNVGTGDIGGTTEIPAAPITVAQAREILNRTPYVTAPAEAAGVKEGVKSTRSALSRAYKEATPGAAEALKKEAELIPKIKLLDEAILKNRGSLGEGVSMRGDFRPRIFGVINPSAKSRFMAAKVLNRTGKIAESEATPALLRILAGIFDEEAY